MDQLKTLQLDKSFYYEIGGDVALDIIPTAEGYIKHVPGKKGAGTYNYVHQYKDHLGNIRMSYSKSPFASGLVIMEENHYYPFGFKHGNYNQDQYVFVSINTGGDGYYTALQPIPTGVADTYKYKYNGKEYQDELGLNMYDYGARNYDPAIGRWMNIDPLAEKYYSYSPYNYCVNNPLSFIDPDGMDVISINGGTKYTGEDAVKIYEILKREAEDRERRRGGEEGRDEGGGINPFSTSDLFDLATKNGVTDKMKAGLAFEKAVLDYLNLSSNDKKFASRGRSIKTGGKYNNVIPDAVTDVDIYSLFGKNEHPDSHFHEAKAVSGWLNLESGSSPYQMLGLIDAAANSTEGGVYGRAIVTLYTTSNTLISPQVIKYANDKKVNLKWAVAYMFNNKLYFTPPVTLSWSAQRATVKIPIGIPQSEGVEIKF
jgi:RHS repeat-associated protein